MRGRLLVFVVGTQRYALALERVHRVVRMVEVAPLPKAPEVVMGVINVKGAVIPVMNMRHRFGVPSVANDINGRIIITDGAERRLGLAVDSVDGLVDYDEEEIELAKDLIPDQQYIAGIHKTQDGMLFIQDLDACLSRQESDQLDKSLN